MRAIYINLDRSADRREWMESQAEKLGIQLERFSAIDGVELPDTPNVDVPRGAMACFLSHRAVWEEIARGPDDHVLVLEDDAHLSSDLPKFMNDASWLPRDADIIHIGRAQKYCRVRGRAQRVLGRKLRRVVGENTGAAAYIISQRCARSLANGFKSIDQEFDLILFNGGRPDLTIYKLLPSLCIQDKLVSSPRFPSLIGRPALVKRRRTASQTAKREFMRMVQKAANILHLTRARRVHVEFL